MRLCVALALIVCAFAVRSGDDANLTFRFPPTDQVTYSWTMQTLNETEGREKGRAFKLSTDSGFTMNMQLKGLLLKRDGVPVAVKLQDVSYTDKKSVDQSKVELYASSRKFKIIEDGKVSVDSENDIGLDKVNDYRERFRAIEAGEVRLILDAAGKPIDATGDAAIVAALKGGGAQGIFPILAGKTVKIGESWEDSFEISMLGDFKLATPAQIKSKMTFAKWEEKDGVKLARIEVTNNWENGELRGENTQGLLVEIAKTDGTGTGWCLFDPAKGQFVEGDMTMVMKYHIQGERAGQAVGLDVNGRTRYMFSRVK